VDRVAESFPELNIARPALPDNGARLNIEGIPEAAQPYNIPGGAHIYPPAEALDAYFERGAVLLNQIDALPEGSAEAFETIAKYYHTMLNAAVFPKINNSMLMTQVNYLLRSKAVHTGVTHGFLDHAAYQLEFDEFLKVFRLHADGQLPTPSQLGINP
jgi:hypothetical protein